MEREAADWTEANVEASRPHALENMVAAAAANSEASLAVKRNVWPSHVIGHANIYNIGV